MASADLGGLAPKEVATVFYDWAAPSLVPQFVPWVAILALLLLKPNRCASAWWIWVPLAVVGWVIFLPCSVKGPSSTPGEMCELFFEVFSALGFGLAAVWLVSSYLARRHRMLSWLGIFVAQGLFSGLPYLLREGFEPGSPDPPLFLALSALVISVALSLTGLVCRGRYGCLRVSLRLLAVLAAVLLLVIAPFCVFGMIAGREKLSVVQLLGSVVQLLGGVVAMSGITFGALLPFLVLSFANGFYRERLKGLLHLGDAQQQPVITPAMPAVTEVAGG